MKLLGKLLTRAFSPAKKRSAPDPHYKAFRKLVGRHKLDYRVTGDGYIEIKPCAALPLGLKTVHHDWQETQNRIELCIATPDAVDSDGYYAE